MAPINEFGSYEHYLVARQAVTENAVNRLTPTEDQKIILIIIGVYTAAILILWNMPIAKIVLSPFKVIYNFYISYNFDIKFLSVSVINSRST